MPTEREFVIKLRIPVTEAGRRLHVNDEKLQQVANHLAGACSAMINRIFKVPLGKVTTEISYLYPVRSSTTEFIPENDIVEIDDICEFRADGRWYRKDDMLVHASN